MTTSNKNTTNIPLHVIEELYKIGMGRQLCLYASLKKVYRSGEFYKYKSIDLKNIGFSISRKTFVKYVIQLKRIGLIRGEYKNGNVVMVLISQKDLLRLYPIKKPLFIKFENNKELHKNYEKLIIERNLYKQLKKRQKRLRSTEFIETLKITKTVRGKRFVETKCPEEDLSISCINLAKLIGKKSAATGNKRQKDWEHQGFINKTKRIANLGKISEDVYNFRSSPISEGGLNQNIFRMPNKFCFITLANEIEIRNSIFLSQRKNVDVIQ